MEDIWLNACRDLEISDEVANLWFNRIHDKLKNAPDRFYHNWDEMLLRKRNHLRDIDCNIVLAVFFQYYEYDVKRNCTEKNCIAFEEFCSSAEFRNDTSIKRIRKMLGDDTVDEVPGFDDDKQILQDLDLMVLGSSVEEYKRYTKLIRKEYSHLEDSTYIGMRLKQLFSERFESANINPSRGNSQNTRSQTTNGNTKNKQQHKSKNSAQARKFIQQGSDLPNIPCTSKNSENFKAKNRNRNSIRRKNRIAIKRAQELLRKIEQGEILNSSVENDCNVETPIAKTLKTKDEDEADKYASDDCIFIENVVEVITVEDDTPLKANNNNQKENCSLVTSAPIIVPSKSNSTPLKVNKNTQKESCSLATSTPMKLPSNNNETPMKVNHKIQKEKCSIVTSTPIILPPKSNHKNEPLFFIDNSPTPWYRTKLQNIPSYEVITANRRPNRNNERPKKEAQAQDDVIIILDDTKPSLAKNSPKRKIPLETRDDVIILGDDIPIRVNNISAQNCEPKPTGNISLVTDDIIDLASETLVSKDNDKNDKVSDNPAQNTKSKRMIIVDGSNVAFHHSLNREFSVEGLKICLDKISEKGHEVKAVVPQFRLQLRKSTDPQMLRKLFSEGKIVFTPCKNLPSKPSSSSYDDRFILQLAVELDAAVVSNDNYKDLIDESAGFKEIIENRVIGYTWCNDHFMLAVDPYGRYGPSINDILNRT